MPPLQLHYANELLIPKQAGMTPFDWADDQGNDAIMAILQAVQESEGKEEL